MTDEIRNMDDRALFDAYVVGDLTDPERWFRIGQEVMRRGLLFSFAA